MFRLVRRMSTLPRSNPLFSNVPKDVWSLTNEAAAHAASQPNAPELINLGQGFFSYSPPEFALEAARKSFDLPLNNQYSPTKGRLSLIDELVKVYSPLYKRELTRDHIQVTTGANEAILACLVGLIESGDEVIVFEPFFDQYIANIEIPGGKVVYVPLHPPADLSERKVSGQEWRIDYAELERAITPRTKAIIINTPHNPIGKVFTREELQQIGDLAVKHNFAIISDEVYEFLYFTEEYTRIATLSPEIARRTLTVGSAGKTFAATGWRIGWVIGEPEFLQYASKAHTRICFASPSPLQEACAEALKVAESNGYFENMRQEYIKKFEILNAVWDELGMAYTVPEGTYFVLVDFSKVKIPQDYEFPAELLDKGKDFRLSYWLINELGVVAIPPTEFYTKEHEHLAENLLRFAVCKSDDYLEKAVERLRGLKQYL